MELEFAIGGIEMGESYSFDIAGREKAASESVLVLNWGPMVKDIMADVMSQLPVGLISAKFHNTLAEMIVAVARRAGLAQVALSGAAFRTAISPKGRRSGWSRRDSGLIGISAFRRMTGG